MIKRFLKRHGGFSYDRAETVIIGGKGDYCAERFGYRQGTNGISPAMSFRPVTPSVKFNYVLFAEYLPLCGLSVFASKYGQLAEWNTADPATVKTVGILSVNYPYVHECIIDGENKYVITSGYYLRKVKIDGTVEAVSLPVKLMSAVLHCGRIFACDLTDRFMIRWSGYDVTDWTEAIDRAGNVRLNSRLGKVLNLFVVNEKIVIVREYGVTVMSTLGDFRHMRIEAGDSRRLPRVYGNSSAICGGKLWIYTGEGMFSFDGNGFSKEPFDGIMSDYIPDKPKVVNDRYIYYSATRGGVKCLFEYDTETGACTPFAKGCLCQFFGADGGYCFNDTVLCSLSEDYDDPDRIWVSKVIDLDTDKLKTLKSVSVESSGDLTVEVDCDGRKLHIDGLGVTDLCECGQKFTFTVTGRGAITRLTAEWEVRK